MKRFLFSFLFLVFSISCTEHMNEKGVTSRTKTDLDMQFLKAAQKNDAIEMISILKENPNVLNGKDKDGNTALHYIFEGAVSNQSGDLQGSTTVLILEGADLNVQNNLGKTPIMVAAEKAGLFDKYTGNTLAPGIDEAVKNLLSHGADPNIVDFSGKTALHYATTVGTLSQKVITQALAASMFDISGHDAYGNTALDYLVQATKTLPLNVTSDFPSFFRVLCTRTLHNPYGSECSPYVAGTKTPTMDMVKAASIGDVETLAKLITFSPEMINGRTNEGTLLGLASKALISSDKDARVLDTIFLLLNSGAKITLEENGALDGFYNFTFGEVSNLDYDSSKYPHLKEGVEILSLYLKEASTSMINGDVNDTNPFIFIIVTKGGNYAYDLFKQLVLNDKVSFNLFNQNGETILAYFIQNANKADSHYEEKLNTLCQNTKNSKNVKECNRK